MTLRELDVAAAPESWSAAGFDVEDGTVQLAATSIRLLGEGAGRRIVAARMHVPPSDRFDGLDGLPPVATDSLQHAAGPDDPHPNGVVRIDHVVAFSPDLDATAAALGDLLGEPRDAVQPGRRIATFRREAALGLPVALMTR